MSNGVSGMYDLANHDPSLGNESWVWASHAWIASPNFGVTHSLSTCAANATLGYMLFYTTANGAPTAITAAFHWNFAANAFTSSGTFSGGAPGYFHGISSATKGYFYTGSITFSSGAFTQPDGPTAPSPSVQSVTPPCGTSSTTTAAIIQYIPTTASVSFSSEVYTFAGGAQVAGPAFGMVFPTGSITSSDGLVNSAGISVGSTGLFYERAALHLSGGPLVVETEIYNFASGAVTLGTAINGGLAAGYNIASNSDPGSF
jgi:hypothetical protein